MKHTKFISAIVFVFLMSTAYAGNLQCDSVDHCIMMATHGDAEAQAKVGVLYLNGYVVKKNCGKALFWLNKSATNGSDYAKDMLGFMYRHGECVQKDPDKAIFWYKKLSIKSKAWMKLEVQKTIEETAKGKGFVFNIYKAEASKGNIKAQYWLGNQYFMLQKFGDAIYWLTKVANKNNPQAMVTLAAIYSGPPDGSDEYTDYKKAAYLMKKAALSGDLEGQYYLGMMYEKGQGVLKDYKGAAYWYIKSAKKGYVWSQFYLSDLYLKGNGVNKDIIKAYAWLNAALTNLGSDGSPYAKERNHLYNIMTLSQRKQAEQLSEIFFKKYVLPFSKKINKSTR